MNRTKFEGVIPAMLTPFDGSGEVNHTAIRSLIERLVGQGVNGLFICGTTGLWWLLSVDERKRIADTTTEAVAGRVKVMVHIGAVRTHDSVELARHAETAGADAISALPPIGFPYPPDSIWQHFKRIGGSCDLPLYLYHLPQLFGDAITMDRFVQALEDIPTLAGVKFSSYQIDHLLELKIKSQGRLNILSGCAEQLLSGMVCGADGSVCSWYNLIPRLARQIVVSVRSGDLDQARTHQDTLIRLIVDIRGRGHWLLWRLVSELGVTAGQPREPLPGPSEGEFASLMPGITARGLFEWTI